MCPSDQVLSAYFDHELEGEWLERIGSHLTECEHCRAKLNSFKALRKGLSEIDAPSTVITPESVVQSYVHRYSRAPFPRAWERNVSIPFPIVVATTVLVLAMAFGFLAQSLFSGPRIDRVPVVESLDAESVEKLAALLEYLESQDAILEMRITLPEDNDFAFSVGEPRLLKATDFRDQP
jgi:anti-sigma factor RsiW